MEKNFKGFILLNWKNGQIKAAKRKPKNVGAQVIVLNLDLNVDVPNENNEVLMKGTVRLTPAKLNDMLLEEL